MSWLEIDPADPFGVQTLPYGATADGPAVRIGEWVLPLRALSAALLPGRAQLFGGGNLDAFLAAGPAAW
ncbi:MAG TPA: fumarylacetoacetase, partial [Jatrophihabitans sp.]|nr:fumarylacetoacetase [Jatrophihabitans sp.]